MCGFVGLVRRNTPHAQSNFPAELYGKVKRSNETLINRGPDYSGLWSDENCVLAHRRLHVIGASENGKQPIRDQSERYSMVYNGAVYNFRELGGEIGQTTTKHSCDTTTIIEGFAKSGKSWFQRLNGMFSIAIWDQKDHELWLARDRFGQKPLYYGWIKSGFIFGSELKALIPLLESQPQPNFEAIHHYLSFGYVPSPLTGFKGLYKLEAGHFLKLKMKGEDKPVLTIQKYVSRHTEPRRETSFLELKAELRSKLEQAVKRCLISSKPLGTFLSGGVDSSAVTAITCRLSAHSVKTFSVGFEDTELDERAYARGVAGHLGTDHLDILFEEADVVSFAENLSDIYDEPFGDSSAMPMMALSHLAKQSVTVALSGDGADELFMGYPRHLEMARQQKLSRLPQSAFKVSKMLASLSGAQRLQNLVHKNGAHPADLYFPMVSQFWDIDKSKNYSPLMSSFSYPTSSQCLRASFDNASDFVEGALFSDQDNYLSEDILTKSDRAAMAVSLEVRTPFLDNDLVDFANSIPWTSKFYDGRLKALLKDSVASLLPNETLVRPKKGFSVPLNSWLNGPLKALVQDVLLSKSAFILTILERSYVEGLLKACVKGVGDHEHRIWSILVLELWAKKWLSR